MLVINKSLALFYPTHSRRQESQLRTKRQLKSSNRCLLILIVDISSILFRYVRSHGLIVHISSSNVFPGGEQRNGRATSCTTASNRSDPRPRGSAFAARWPRPYSWGSPQMNGRDLLKRGLPRKA